MELLEEVSRHENSTDLGRLSDFHDGLACLQTGAHAGPCAFDGSRESGFAAVAQANPDQVDERAGLRRAVEEVLVLADQDNLALSGVAPDLGVGSLGETHVADVQALAAGATQVASQCNGKLVVDEESHEARRTGWSA